MKLLSNRLISAALGAATAAGVALAPLTSAFAQGLIRDSEIERTLQMLTSPIFSVAGLHKDEVPIFIINDKSLNAFVSGGRSMFFHTGLLQTLQTPEELMGVIAHETGHITGGHIVRRITAIENARTTSILTAILGIGAAAAGGGGAGAGVFSGGQSIAARDLAKFTRGQEASADQAALKYLNDAGVDPSGMLEVLERLERENSVYLSSADPFLLSHPLSRERIRMLQLGVSQSPVLGRKVSSELTYWHTRMRAKLDGFLSAPGSRGESYGNKEFDLYREAISLHRLPDPDGAVAAIDQLISMRPNDPYYWELKGQILAESGRGPQAVEPYRKAVNLARTDALISGGLGKALLTVETPEADKEALAVLEKAAIDDPYDPGVRRSLAIAYARKGDDGMAAVVTAERLALNGSVGDARRQAERAKAMLPTGSPGWLRAEDILNLPKN